MGENLGQHFLVDDTVVEEIVSAGSITDDDTVLEIGPGEGVLTDKLLQVGAEVVAVEKDPQLARKLSEQYRDEITKGKLALHKGDIRDFELQNFTNNEEYKVIANIPYYLTAELLQLFLRTDSQPTIMVLLLQKEVADRILRKDGKQSRLSLFVEAYGTPEIIRSVDKQSFSPPPKVDSAVLKITDINRDFFADIDESDFFDLIRIGFQHKRKQLKNNLSEALPAGNLITLLEDCGIKSTTRPEKVRLDQWRCLYAHTTKQVSD